MRSRSESSGANRSAVGTKLIAVSRFAGTDGSDPTASGFVAELSLQRAHHLVGTVEAVGVGLLEHLDHVVGSSVTPRVLDELLTVGRVVDAGQRTLDFGDLRHGDSSRSSVGARRADARYGATTNRRRALRRELWKWCPPA